MIDRDFFDTHGYLHLKGYLGGPEAAALGEEVGSALRENYPIPAGPPAEVSGYDGFYLPLMGPLSPISRGLVSSGRLFGLAEELLGTPVLPKPAKGMHYRDASPFHADSTNPDLRAVKFVSYFEPLTAETGALRVLPGSHLPDYHVRLAARRAAAPAGNPFAEEAEAAAWPAFALPCAVGDLIAFDVRLWHASLFGRARLQWSVSYAADPVTEPERLAMTGYIKAFLAAGHDFDLDRYPYYDPDWFGPDRPAFAERMAELGLFSPMEASR